MKINLLSFFLLVSIFVSETITAQNPYRRGGGMNQMDNTRNAAPREKEPVDFVKQSTEKMTKDLNLDGFQSAVVKTIMEDFEKEYKAIVELQIPNEGKQEKVKIASEKMEARVVELLNPEQKIKFAAIKDKAEKKDKKKKKGKKDEEKVEEIPE